MKYLR
jgi:hypothetical protein